jgi:uncharacterized membrane protein YphA (DoxX/SURF4 family)
MEQTIARLRSSRLLQLLIILTRFVLGIAFVWASIFKIMNIRFTPTSGEQAPINSLPHLLESMYRSGYYWRFIGWGQLMAGFLMMSQRFSTLGAVVFFPMMVSIFVISTAFTATGVMVVTALMLFATTLLLLWDWHRLKYIVLPTPGAFNDAANDLSKQTLWFYIAIALSIVIVIFRVYVANNILSHSSSL